MQSARRALRPAIIRGSLCHVKHDDRLANAAQEQAAASVSLPAPSFPRVSGHLKFSESKAATTRKAPWPCCTAEFAAQTPLVRIHSQCLTGDVLASERCDCRAQLELSLRRIAASPSGILLYLPQEGRGIGLMNKLRAYELQDHGMDTVEANEELGFAADSRDYAFSAAALKLLGVRRVRLLSNNPDKVQQLENAGIRVVERVPCRPRTSRISRAYLETKRTKMGHLLERR